VPVWTRFARKCLHVDLAVVADYQSLSRVENIAPADMLLIAVSNCRFDP